MYKETENNSPGMGSFFIFTKSRPSRRGNTGPLHTTSQLQLELQEAKPTKGVPWKRQLPVAGTSQRRKQFFKFFHLVLAIFLGPLSIYFNSHCILPRSESQWGDLVQITGHRRAEANIRAPHPFQGSPSSLTMNERPHFISSCSEIFPK